MTRSNYIIDMNIENPNPRMKKRQSTLEKIEVEEEGPKVTLTLQESLAKSRQIHMNRMKKVRKITLKKLL